MSNDIHVPLRTLKYRGADADFCVLDLAGEYNFAETDEPGILRNSFYTVLWPMADSDFSLSIDFSSYPVRTDELFFILPRQIHRFDGPRFPEGKVIAFSDAFLAEGQLQPEFLAGLKIFSNLLQNEPLHIDPSRTGKLRFYLEEMISTMSKKGEYINLTLGSLLKLFLIECTGVCNADIEARESGQLVLVKRFKDAVEEDFRSEHKVGYYASELAVSPGYLNDVVRSSTGFTTKEYIRKRIVLEAKRLLKYSDIRVNELAYELGYSDPLYFSKSFKKETGLSAKQFAMAE